MTHENQQEKKCADCNRPITFEHFCQNNPSISSQKAKYYWENPLFLIYCPECFFALPEKPFKFKRRYLNYYNRRKK